MYKLISELPGTVFLNLGAAALDGFFFMCGIQVKKKELTASLKTAVSKKHTRVARNKKSVTARGQYS